VIFVYTNYNVWGTGNGTASTSVDTYGIMVKIAPGQWILVATSGPATNQANNL
jgi:hypothetical protein